MYKYVIHGRLEFGSEVTIEKASKQYLTRGEVYYKNDLIVKHENLFKPEQTFIEIHKCIGITVDKTWRSTKGLLKEIAQYAVSGEIHCWIINEKTTVKTYYVVEPNSDKTGNNALKEARQLIREHLDLENALDKVNEAIDKTPMHFTAYYLRGVIYSMQNNWEDAILDFTKAIAINPNYTDAFLSRAKVLAAHGNHEAAIQDLEVATLFNLPHHPGFWQARFHKAYSLFHFGEVDKAKKELDFFLKREFLKDDPNLELLHDAWKLQAALHKHDGKTADSDRAIQQSEAFKEKYNQAARKPFNIATFNPQHKPATLVMV